MATSKDIAEKASVSAATVKNFKPRHYLSATDEIKTARF